MKKSRVAMLVAGALIAGLTLGAMGVASAANRTPQPTTPSYVGNPVVTPAVDGTPSDVDTSTPSVPSTDAVVPHQGPRHRQGAGNGSTTPCPRVGSGTANTNATAAKPCPRRSAPAASSSAAACANSNATGSSNSMMGSGGMMGRRN